MTAPIGVLIVDDDALVRAGLSMILAGVEDIRVVGEVADGADVVAAVDRYRPDVVLMDIRMAHVDGLTATELLRSRRDPPEVIVLTTFDSDDHVLRALRAGASGFLLRHLPPPEIARAIRLVAAGEPMLSPTVLRRMMSQVVGGGAGEPRDRARGSLRRLSDGELAVATLVAQGKTNREIGRELFMSVATVKAYVSRVLTKLELTKTGCRWRCWSVTPSWTEALGRTAPLASARRPAQAVAVAGRRRSAGRRTGTGGARRWPSRN